MPESPDCRVGQGPLSGDESLASSPRGCGKRACIYFGKIFLGIHVKVQKSPEQPFKTSDHSGPPSALDSLDGCPRNSGVLSLSVPREHNDMVSH